MTKKIEYRFGENINPDSLLSYLFDDVEKKGERRAFFLCECENIKSIFVSLVKIGNTKSCGCYHKEKVSRHGNSQKRSYKVWKGMIYRGQGRSGREFYFDKGVKVCDEWLHPEDGYDNFVSDMGEPRDNETIERIDRNGNYCKENCKWAKISEQLYNRDSPRNTSGKVGVSFHKKSKKWAAIINKEGVKYNLGYFTNYDDAVKARLNAELKYYGRNC